MTIYYLQFNRQCLDGQAIGVEPEATDDTTTGTADHGVVTELLALVDIRDMYLDDRALQRADAVVQGYAGMGVGTGVEHDAVALAKARLLHLVDELTLDVALIVININVGISIAQT